MTFNPSDYHDITDYDLTKFVNLCYQYSQPQGMGFLHFEPGAEVPAAELERILTSHEKDTRIRLSMDYVLGRSVKMTVFKNAGRLYIRKDWYDHSTDTLDYILTQLTEGE